MTGRHAMPYQEERPARPVAALTRDRDVQCRACHLIGPSSLIPDIGWGPRCADIWACSRRFAEGARPQSLPQPVPVTEAPRLDPLPKRIPAASTEAEAADMTRALAPLRSRLQETDPPAPQPALPPDQEAAMERFEAAHAEQDAADAEPEPAAEPGTEGESPAPAADAPLPVAEVSQPSHEPRQSDEALDQ